MNILLASVYHISNYYGGNEHYLHHLAVGLSKAGHHVIYLTGKASNINSYPYRIITSELPHVLGKPLPSVHWQRVINAHHIDIFHASGSGIPLLTAGLALRNRKIPTILTYQANTHPTNPLFYLPAKMEMALIPKAFSTIITTSPHYRQHLQILWHDKPGNPTLIFNTKLSIPIYT